MDRKKMNEDLGNIMHGLSDTSAVPDDIVFVNMPHFPMISESKGLSLMLCSSLRSWKMHGNDCIDCIVDAVYIKEKYIYRYFDYRQAFSEQKNHGTITVSIQFAYSDTVRINIHQGFSHKMEDFSGDEEETIDPKTGKKIIKVKSGKIDSIEINENPMDVDAIEY